MNAKNQPKTQATKTRSITEGDELTLEQLDQVSGGLEPQPLPPRDWRIGGDPMYSSFGNYFATSGW